MGFYKLSKSVGVAIFSMMLAMPTWAQSGSRAIDDAQGICSNPNESDELLLCAIWTTNNQILAILEEIAKSQSNTNVGVASVSNSLKEVKKLMENGAKE
jgi:response regulator of citrate/malate metabolism